MSNETSTETNKPIEAQELTEKELKGVVGGGKPIVPTIWLGTVACN